MTALNFTGCLIAAATALLSSTGEQHREIIEGRYCGTAWSGGRLVEVVTTLTTEAGGMLAGVYEFADNGEDTPGTLREYVRETDVDLRTLVWIDKYGTGWLTIRFDKGRNSFDGNWGVEFDPPTYRWDGQRCDGVATLREIPPERSPDGIGSIIPYGSSRSAARRISRPA